MLKMSTMATISDNMQILKQNGPYICFQLFWIISNVFLLPKSRKRKTQRVLCIRKVKATWLQEWSLLLRYITRGFSVNSHFRWSMHIFSQHREILLNMCGSIYRSVTIKNKDIALASFRICQAFYERRCRSSIVNVICSMRIWP